MYIKKNYQVSTQIPANPEHVSLDQLAQYLSGIQVDINNLHRELTYWDLYKINYVIEDVESANGIINNLAPGQAAVIGFEKTSKVDNVNRSRGDIVIKLINDKLFWIDSKSSGIYKPTGYSNNSLTYTYSNEEPTGSDRNISITATSATSRTIYSDVFSLTTSDTTKSFTVISNIRPVIRFYTSNNEIIDLNFTLSLSGGTYTITWDANPLLSGGWLQVK